ncbi:ATP-binding protein [Streptomyces sp. NPDC056002]|uniref:ATP-binding protein n=1 Tax=Streptomyces sp. NPDC056002 TaxID=3345675 RepID=UPI0035DA69AC
MATGLGIRACQAGLWVAFATAAQWVTRLAEAHTAGRLSDELTRLGRIPLIVVDEVGYIPFEPEAANLFFQFIWAASMPRCGQSVQPGDDVPAVADARAITGRAGTVRRTGQG